MTSASPILFVDLDNTLTRSDLFLEPLLKLLKSDPMVLFLLPKWLLQGRGYFKQQLSDRISIDVTEISFDEEVKEYLVKQRQSGRKIVLATASNQVFADQVAEHLGLFDHVIASSVDLNTKGKNKLSAMKRYADGQDFDYLGDSHADVDIWGQIGRAVVVSPQAGVLKRLEKHNIPTELIHPAPAKEIYLQAMRPQHWLKNLLIFIPLILTCKIFSIASISATIFAFISFCLVASAGYIVNDLLDLEADRKHPQKKNRPIAGGILALWNVAFLAKGLLLLGLILGCLISCKLALLLFAYFLLVVIYSLRLKDIDTLGTMAVIAFYTARILAGSIAIGSTLSNGMLIVTILIFFGWQKLKQRTEHFTN